MSWEKEYNDPSVLEGGVCWPLAIITGLVFLFFLVKVLFKQGVL